MRHDMMGGVVGGVVGGAWGAALLTIASLAMGGAVYAQEAASAQKAVSTQRTERSLLGIRLNTNSRSVLDRYGNPTQVVIGEVGIRTPGPAGGEGQGGFNPAGFGGGNGSFSGAPSSLLATGREVTWIYNRNVTTKDGSSTSSLISYQFFIGADGRVMQIRALGYGSGGGASGDGSSGGARVKTARGITLGATRSQVVQKYGSPELEQQAGPLRIASYTKRARVSFQFLRNKVIAITVAAIE